MLAGSLSEFSIPDLFSLLSATRKTGVLNMNGESADGAVWISQGQIAFAAGDVSRSPLVARLLHGGELTTEDAERVVACQSQNPFGVPDVLSEGGVARDRTATLIRDAVIDAVFDLSRWDGGTFAFDASIDPVTPSVLVSTDEVMAAVDERLADWPRILEQVPSPEHVLAAVARPGAASGELGDARLQITMPQWEVLTLIDGHRSVADLVRLTGQGSYGVGVVLASLISGGLVEVQADGAAESHAEAAARHLAGMEHRLLGASQAPVAAAAPRIAQPRPPAPARTDLSPAHHGDDAADEARSYETPGAPHEPDAVAAQASPQPLDAPAPSQTGAPDPVQAPAHDAGDRAPVESELDDLPEFDPLMDLPRDEPAAPAAKTESDAAAARRNRELAALGLGGDSPASTGGGTATATAQPKVKRDSSVDSDLLARLIDGVKGG